MEQFIVIIYLVLTVVIGTMVFYKINKTSSVVYFGSLGKSIFSFWLSCVVATGFVLGIIGMVFLEAVVAIIDFIATYYLHMIGAVTFLVGIALLIGLFEPVNGENIADADGGKKKKRNGIIVCCLGIAVFGGGMIKNNHVKEPAPVVNSMSTNELAPKTSSKVPTVEKKIEESTILKAQKLLESNKVAGTVIATSLENNTKGFVSIIKKNNTYSFILFDQINHQVAQVPFSFRVYNFYLHPQDKYQTPLLFEMTIFNDKHDRDEKNGVWNGDNHMIPIYALYKFDQNANVVPGMLHSGEGAKPSHYQSFLNEQKNVDIANLFLVEMKALQKNANANQVVIPVD